MLEEKWHVCEYYIIFGSTKLIFIFRDKIFPGVLSGLAGCQGPLNFSTHPFGSSSSPLISESPQEACWGGKDTELLELKYGCEERDTSHTSYEKGASQRRNKTEPR